MSYAIIRNTKYKRENLTGIYRHNERRNKNYSNDNIDKERSYLNYSIKSPKYRYDKEFDMMKERYNLKGQIKTVSNIACEYIITSDKEFFETIGEEETKRYFETAYNFVAEYKNLGEQYIMSAKVHMDEETPHCLKEIKNKCEKELKLSLNEKTQIGIVRNGIDFLGYRHILNGNGSITRKLRAPSKKRLKRHLKTLKKMREKDIVDDNYVYIM